MSDFDAICTELARFRGPDGLPADDRSGLSGKPQLAAANKMDALDEPGRLEDLRRHLATRSVPLYAVSAVTGDGLPALLNAMWAAVQRPPGQPDGSALQESP